MYIHAGLTEKTGQQGDQGNTDEGNTTTGHKLFYTLGLGAGVVLAVTFQKVDAAPYAERTAEGYNEGLQSFDCRVEEFHIYFTFPDTFCAVHKLLIIGWDIWNPGSARMGGVRCLRVRVVPKFHLPYIKNFRRLRFSGFGDFINIKIIVGFCLEFG